MLSSQSSQTADPFTLDPSWLRFPQSALCELCELCVEIPILCFR
jgi:hypothetical protein